jgi:hypothetical protein
VGFGGVHYHRFLEQHVQPGFQAGFGLPVMQGVRSDDEYRLQAVGVILEQAGEIRLVGGWFETGAAEDFLGHGISFEVRFADDDDLQSLRLFEHLLDGVAGHQAGADQGEFDFVWHTLFLGFNQLDFKGCSVDFSRSQVVMTEVVHPGAIIIRC